MAIEEETPLGLPSGIVRFGEAVNNAAGDVNPSSTSKIESVCFIKRASVQLFCRVR